MYHNLSVNSFVNLSIKYIEWTVNASIGKYTVIMNVILTDRIVEEKNRLCRPLSHKGRTMIIVCYFNGRCRESISI